MTTGFSRTLRGLGADGFGWPAAGIVVAVCLAMAWAAWCTVARVTLYEVTETARLEVHRAVTPVQSPIGGQVVAASLAIGREVRAGDVLLDLDTDTQQLQLLEEHARRAATEEAKASARQADAPARFAESDAQRLTELRATV